MFKGQEHMNTCPWGSTSSLVWLTMQGMEEVARRAAESKMGKAVKSLVHQPQNIGHYPQDAGQLKRFERRGV